MMVIDDFRSVEENLHPAAIQCSCVLKMLSDLLYLEEPKTMFMHSERLDRSIEAWALSRYETFMLTSCIQRQHRIW